MAFITGQIEAEPPLPIESYPTPLEMCFSQHFFERNHVMADCKEKAGNFTVAVFELIIAVFLIIKIFRKLPKWSANATTPSKRIGFISLCLAGLILAFTVIHWNFTRETFIYTNVYTYEVNDQKTHTLAWKESVSDYFGEEGYRGWFWIGGLLLIAGTVMHSGRAEKLFRWIWHGDKEV